MKKHIGKGLIGVFLIILGSCTTTTTTVLPTPDFANLMAKASPFKGTKVDLVDPFNTRDISVTATAKNDSTVILKDGDTQIEATLFNKSKNLALLSIKQQTPNIVGFKDAATKDPRDHGFFLLTDNSGNTVNELTFNVQIGAKKWTYLLKK